MANEAKIRFALQRLEPERPVPFTCLGSECPNTCCGPFHGTRALAPVLSHDDLGPVLGADEENSRDVSIFAQIRLTDRDVLRLQRAGLDEYIVRRGDPAAPDYYMRLAQDGSCAALAKDGLCSIHPSRPTLCRAFPFYFDLFAGLAMVASCPGVGAGEQTVEELRPDIAAAVEMYDFWMGELSQSSIRKGDKG